MTHHAQVFLGLVALLDLCALVLLVDSARRDGWRKLFEL